MIGEPLFAIASKVAPLVRGGRFRFNRVLSEAAGKSSDGEPWAAILTNDLNAHERLYIRADWHAKGRLGISGMVPDAYRAGEWTSDRASRITVAADRHPAGIAGDIMRRLLPAYRKELAQRLADENTRKGAAEILEQKINLLQSVSLDFSRLHYERDKYTFRTRGGCGTASQYYDGEWRVEVRLGFDDLVRLLVWLNGNTRQAPSESELQLCE